MDNVIKEISYGDGETNYFGAQSSKELQEKLDKADKFELRGLASKVGVNPSHNKQLLKELIMKEFKHYIGRNGPKQAPKQMFANADKNSDVFKMMESVAKINAEEKEKRKKKE